MEVNAEVKRGKERQRNSPVDCFDISPKVHSTCDKIHPLPPRRHKLYIACGDFFISFFKIATSLIPLLLLFPKKLTLFVDPESSSLNNHNDKKTDTTNRCLFFYVFVQHIWYNVTTCPKMWPCTWKCDHHKCFKYFCLFFNFINEAISL